MFLLFVLIAAQIDFIVGSFFGPTDDLERAQGFIGYTRKLSLEIMKKKL